MLHVKRGDRILIPHLPQRGNITIAEATQDWSDGYSFSVWEKTNDHGHIFPVNYLTNFNRHNQKVPASLRGTFRNPSRFWNITSLLKDIEAVLQTPVEDLGSTSSVVDRWQQQIEEVIRDSGLRTRLFSQARDKIRNAEWEDLLVDVLQRLNSGWKVRRTGGFTEKQHGTDILATIPDIFRNGEYGIAIQVKDHRGHENDAAIHQILKAKDYWEERGINILEAVVLLIGGERKVNKMFEESAKRHGVRIIWSTEIEQLVLSAACQFISDPDRQVSAPEPVGIE